MGLLTTLVFNPIFVIVGFLYPAYQSYKALESNRQDAAPEWLTYWVIFSLFTVIESVGTFLISWIPFYSFLKLAFLMWLLLPRFKGASKLYQALVQPFMKKHEEKIDHSIMQGFETVTSMGARIRHTIPR
mmetsp:Transcript_3749/g.9471  ORF Transcript_3749/g.9471 Transcript_3749/m.9471 type:complete len:130 (+) Transcript_3749:156-545(+)